MRSFLLVLLLSTGLACRDATPSRLVVGLDTLLINGPAPIALPVAVQQREGRTIERSTMQIVVSSDSAVMVANGAARCRTAGDANGSIRRPSVKRGSRWILAVSQRL